MKKEIKSTSNTKASFVKQPLASAHPAKVIVLMSMPTPIHAVTAVLDMPTDYNGRKDRAAEIIAKCTDNHYVTIAPDVIDAAEVKLATYVAATTAAEKNAAYPPVHNACKSLMSMFQNAANDDIANAIVIIESGSFKVKNIVINQKHEFAAANGLTSGDITITAEGGPVGSVHNWNYSHDGVTWIKMDGTHYAHTHKDGFTPGSTAYFTHNLSIDDVPQGLSQVFEIIVK